LGDVIKDDYQTDYVAGQDNIEKFGFDIHNIVFPLTAILIVAFVVGTLIFPSGAKELLDSAKNGANFPYCPGLPCCLRQAWGQG
jgi:BCCT family betaine/carnitine transporter